MRHPGASLGAGRMWGFVSVRSGACGAGTKMSLCFRESGHPLRALAGGRPQGRAWVWATDGWLLSLSRLGESQWCGYIFESLPFI